MIFTDMEATKMHNVESGIEFRGMDIETEIQFQGMDIQERGKKTKKNRQKLAGIGKF